MKTAPVFILRHTKPTKNERVPRVARVSPKNEYFTSLFAEQRTNHFLKKANTQRKIKSLYQHVNWRSRGCFADIVLNHRNFKWSLVQRFPQQISTDTRPTLSWLRGSFSASSSDINTSRLLQLFNYHQPGPARPDPVLLLLLLLLLLSWSGLSERRTAS